MPGVTGGQLKSRDFIRVNEMVALGILSVFVGLLIQILLVPQLSLSRYGFILSTVLFLLIWLIIYIGMIIGALVEYYIVQGEIKSSSAKAGKRKK